MNIFTSEGSAPVAFPVKALPQGTLPPSMVVFDCPAGTEVFSAVRGVVHEVGDANLGLGANGVLIQILEAVLDEQGNPTDETTEGGFVAFGYLSAAAPMKHQRVSVGTRIGETGNTPWGAGLLVRGVAGPDGVAPSFTEATGFPASADPTDTAAPSVSATPAAEAHAAAVNVDLTQVTGTSADGNILKSDVQAAADAGTAVPPTAPDVARVEPIVVTPTAVEPPASSEAPVTDAPVSPDPSAPVAPAVEASVTSDPLAPTTYPAVTPAPDATPAPSSNPFAELQHLEQEAEAWVSEHKPGQ